MKLVLGSIAVASAFALHVGCAALREGPTQAEPLDAGAAADATEPPPVADGPLKVAQVDDPAIARVNYRGVYAVARDQVFVAGDETLLEWDGSAWTKWTMPNIQFNGVWSNGPISLAVGIDMSSTRGVVYQRRKSEWSEIHSTEQGLTAIWGSGISGSKDRLLIVGRGGLTVYGSIDQPFLYGVIQQVPDDIPAAIKQQPFFPVMLAAASNGPDRLLVGGPLGAFYVFDGKNWRSFFQRADTTRGFTTAFARSRDAWDVLLGGNYYGLWEYRGKDVDAGRLAVLHEERGDPLRAQQSILGIWGETTDRFIAVGSTGRVMLYEKGKGAPTILPSPVGAVDLRAVSGLSFEDLWIVGDNGTLLRGSVTF